ncbi:MAG: bifunctional homocysteine S-methyltransferase/methylenetetrahydrofolate reductase [Armatimonadetes bacterium]|nr:bifunctional homocysteine S-methyltransferase/methylenetetrahydrofolate reductase [Armatimonadota bacterium]
MSSQSFLDRIRSEVLLGDGGMGSMLHSLGIPAEASFESLNLSQPDLVAKVHEEYVAAGAQLIETNTFGANRNKLASYGQEDQTREINLAGARLARGKASAGILVAGSVGPLGKTLKLERQLTDSEQLDSFREQITALAEGGVDLVMLETFSDLDEIALALRATRAVCDLPVVCQMAFTNELRTMGGVGASQALRALEEAGAEVVGGNCGAGPRALIKVIEQISGTTNKPLSAFPNASYPRYEEGRYFFVGSAQYLADSAEQLANLGVNLIGGCCGTTPDHIRAMAQRLRDRTPAARPQPVRVSVAEVTTAEPDAPGHANFLDKVGKETVCIVELDPPRGLLWGPVVEGARKLAEAGTDAISVAENSLASIRMSSMVVGHFIQRDAGLPAIVHCTCRDRNLIGQQSELMGASALGIRLLLAITGDPVSMGGVLGATSVYDTNSFGLIDMISKLNQGENLAGSPLGRRTDFIIGAGFNPNVRKMEVEIKRLAKKVANGAVFAMTQPVFNAERVRSMYERTAHLGIPIFLGVLPLYSARNTEFLHNEVPGIRIPDEVRQRMREASPDEASKTGIEIAAELIVEVLDVAPGIYIIPPFSKHELALPLVEVVKGQPAKIMD